MPWQLGVAEQSGGVLAAVGRLQTNAVERIEILGPVAADPDWLAVHDASIVLATAGT